jgi:hypothetical protein
MPPSVSVAVKRVRSPSHRITLPSISTRDRVLDQTNLDLAESWRILDHPDRLAYQPPSTEPSAPDVGLGL